MIYTIEGSTKMKAHYAHFTTIVKCLLNKIGNGKKGITSWEVQNGEDGKGCDRSCKAYTVS